MSIMYLTQQAGQLLAVGLSTDTKPLPAPANTLFSEVDTGRSYFAQGGAWIPRAALGQQAVAFAAEGIKTVVVANPLILAGSNVRDTNIRLAAPIANLWFLVNVVGVAVGQFTAVIVPQHEQGANVRVATHTGTVTLEYTVVN